VLAYVLGGFILVGRGFVNLWAGPEYDLAWHVAVVVMISLTVPLAQGVGVHIVQARNVHGFRSVLNLVVALVNALACALLVGRWGALGAGIATAGSLVAGHVVVMNAFYHRRVGLDIPRFFRRVAHRLVPAALAACGGGALVASWMPGSSWRHLALRAAVFTALYAAAMWSYGLDASERRALTSLVTSERRARRALAGEGPLAP
jgi:O-antigen/teichoic acid export membrane protein